MAADSGLRPAEGPILQIHPAHRLQRLSVPALQPVTVRLALRNAGRSPLTVRVAVDVPWVEVPEPDLSLAPRATAEMVLTVPPLTLRPGSSAFTVHFAGDSLLGDEEARVELVVGPPVRLEATYRSGRPPSAAAWETVPVDLEVRRSDGAPCRIGALSADPWPHWILTSDVRQAGASAIVRLEVVAPGRRKARQVRLSIDAAEPGITRAELDLTVERESGPVLVWEEDSPDPGLAETADRDTREWAALGLDLPPVLPGDRRTGGFRIRNVGDRPASLSVRVDPADASKPWLVAGLASRGASEDTQAFRLQPGRVAEVRVDLRVPLPDATRRGAVPAAHLTWPGARVVVAEHEGQELTRTVTGTVLAAIQPAVPRARLTAAAIDACLPLGLLLLLYVMAWALLGDYRLAMLAQPILQLVGGRWYSLAPGAVLLLWWPLYAVLLAFCPLLYGTTPGKAYAGLQLRHPDGRPVSRARTALRGLLQALFMPLLAWWAVVSAGPGPVDRLLKVRVAHVVSLWDEPS